jgi:hypothetical protein
MKKILIALLVLLGFASIAMAAPYLLGTKKLPGEDFVMETIWAHPKSSTTGLINATGATKSYNTGSMCDTGSVIFETVTGSNIMNIAMQVAYDGDPLDVQGRNSLFTNAIGTTSAPYHQVDAGDSDTLKFDFNSRGFDRWRLNCLAGCGVNNTISEVYGVCWRSGK